MDLRNSQKERVFLKSRNWCGRGTLVWWSIEMNMSPNLLVIYKGFVQRATRRLVGWISQGMWYLVLEPTIFWRVPKNISDTKTWERCIRNWRMSCRNWVPTLVVSGKVDVTIPFFNSWIRFINPIDMLRPLTRDESELMRAAKRWIAFEWNPQLELKVTTKFSLSNFSNNNLVSRKTL